METINTLVSALKCADLYNISFRNIINRTNTANVYTNLFIRIYLRS